MRFALNENNEKIEVSESGQIAKCPSCDSIVIGKFGEFNRKHWSHKIKDCDSWYEPITDWHLEWQNHFPEKFKEVTLKDKVNGIIHRADIQLTNKLVIEIQYSPIKIKEIKQREDFYGTNNLIWILNGQNLAKKSEIIALFNPKKIQLELTIPNDVFCEIDNYDMDEFKTSFFKSETFKALKKTPSLTNFSVKNGDLLIFKFSKDIKMDYIETCINHEFREICKELYLNYEYLKKEIHFNIIRNLSDNYSNVNLLKTNWRKFIDEFKYPVFIDKLNGLDERYIYWLQENKIVSKDRFLKKYLKYT
jgi:competence protein CoiA